MRSARGWLTLGPTVPLADDGIASDGGASTLRLSLDVDLAPNAGVVYARAAIIVLPVVLASILGNFGLLVGITVDLLAILWVWLWLPRSAQDASRAKAYAHDLRLVSGRACYVQGCCSQMLLLLSASS